MKHIGLVLCKTSYLVELKADGHGNKFHAIATFLTMKFCFGNKNKYQTDLIIFFVSETNFSCCKRDLWEKPHVPAL